METAPETAAPATPKFEEITLETAIVRGTTTIESIQLRKPKAGELRGLQLQALMQGDVNAILAMVPRISMPPLIAQEVEQLELADLAAVTGAVTGFFMTKADQAMLAKVLGAVETEGSTN